MAPSRTLKPFKLTVTQKDYCDFRCNYENNENETFPCYCETGGRTNKTKQTGLWATEASHSRIIPQEEILSDLKAWNQKSDHHSKQPVLGFFLIKPFSSWYWICLFQLQREKGEIQIFLSFKNHLRRFFQHFFSWKGYEFILKYI